jgi:hypothetical protein
MEPEKNEIKEESQEQEKSSILASNNIVQNENQKNYRKMIFGLLIVIVSTALITSAIILFFDTKPTINIKQNCCDYQTIKAVNATGIITSLQMSGQSTIATLDNGFQINDTAKVLQVGKKVELLGTVDKPICTISVYYKNNTIISEPFSILASNNYSINGTKNPDCDPNKREIHVKSVRLLP